MTIQDRVVSFGLAKLAKAKGFKVICDRMYDSGGSLEEYNNFKYNLNTNYTLAPTQGVLAEWIRIIYKIHVSISTEFISEKPTEVLYYHKLQYLSKREDKENTTNKTYCSDYYNVYEDGLYKALKTIE